MTKTTTRALTAEERAELEGLLNPRPAGRPGRLMGFMMALPVGFTALVVLNVFLPAPGFVRLLLAVAAFGGAAWLFGRWATARHEGMLRPSPQVEDVLRKDLAEERAAITRYDAEAVVKVVADPRRFVSATYFLRLVDGSVVLLVGPHLEEAECAGEFPATAFEIASGESSRFVLSVKSVGEKLVPEKTRAPLSDAEWEEIGEDDDEGVPLEWAEILDRARLNPPSEGSRDRKREERAAARRMRSADEGEPVPPSADPIRPK